MPGFCMITEGKAQAFKLAWWDGWWSEGQQLQLMDHCKELRLQTRGGLFLFSWDWFPSHKSLAASWLWSSVHSLLLRGFCLCADT